MKNRAIIRDFVQVFVRCVIRVPGSVTLKVRARLRVSIERSFCIRHVEVVHEVFVVSGMQIIKEKCFSSNFSSAE